MSVEGSVEGSVAESVEGSVEGSVEAPRPLPGTREFVNLGTSPNSPPEFPSSVNL